MLVVQNIVYFAEKSRKRKRGKYLEKENILLKRRRKRREILRANKGRFQKRFSGFFPLRGGVPPPIPLGFFGHNDFLLTPHSL